MSVKLSDSKSKNLPLLIKILNEATITKRLQNIWATKRKPVNILSNSLLKSGTENQTTKEKLN